MILLIIEQDHADVMLLGIPIFAALTRIGPGLAALGVGRNPEGAVVEIGACVLGAVTVAPRRP